jgi:hypothetical protein
VRLAAQDIQLDITEIGAAKAIVGLPQDAWRGVADIILSISYRGDVGNATIDGALISDNFANGAPWEIGLRRHAERLREQAIDLYITPLRQGQAVVSDSAMAAQQSFVGQEIAAIDSIVAIPQYQLRIVHQPSAER